MLGDHQLLRVVRELAPLTVGAAADLAGVLLVPLSAELAFHHVAYHLSKRNS